MKTKYTRITKFTLAMLILLVVQLSNVIAQEPLPPTAKDKCVSGDCKNGYGKIIYSTGDSYEGNYVNGFANGKGKEIHVDGSVYEGDFVSGKFAGQGIYTFKNGVVYVGQFANNLYNGKGKIKFANGNSYDGDWVNGKYEGQGTYTFKDGSYYIGEWKNGKYNGYGKQYDKSINKLAEGTWKDDILVNSTAAAAVTPTVSDKCVSGDCVNGKGKIIYTNGNIYEGDFVDGKRKGQGTYTYKNGQVYIGQFYDDLRNGKGKFTFSDGSSYEGSFVTDNFIGYGTYTSKSGSNQTGKFTVGQIVDLQSKVLDTDFWGKAEIIEILGDKYKVRDLRFKTIEIVAEQKIRPFTEPVKYEIGQKVDVLNLGIWYKGEIIGLEVESNDHYRIRFEGTTKRSDTSENVRYIRPGIASSTAQTRQEYSSPLWIEKFGISEQLLTKKMLAEANNDYVGCESKYNTLVPPTKLETSSSRAFADVVGGFGEDNKILVVYAIGNANLNRIKGTNVKTSRVGFTKPQLLIKKQETNENGNKINLNVIPLVFNGSDSYQIEADPKNDDYTGIIKFVCNAPKSPTSMANLTEFTPITNGSSSGSAVLSNAKESAVDANIAAKRLEIDLITKSAGAKKTNKERIEPAKQMLKLQNELVQYLTDAINGEELSENAKAKYRKSLETEKAKARQLENLLKVTIEAAKYEQ